MLHRRLVTVALEQCKAVATTLACQADPDELEIKAALAT
jgi:hypothetical protein